MELDSFYTVTRERLAGLKPDEAVRLFSDLLCAEAMANNVLTSAISVPFAVDTPDGGIDAEVTGVAGTPGQGLIKSGRTRYQIKTGSFSLAANKTDAQEILLTQSRKGLKPKIKSCLDNGDTLVVVLFGSDNPEPEDDAVVAKFKEVLKPFDAKYESAKIEVFRPNQLIRFLEPYPSLRIKLLGRGNLPFYDLESWGGTTEMQKPLVLGDSQNSFIDGFRQNIFPNNRPVHIRIIGEPGIGKSRLALESLKADGLQNLVIYCESPERLLGSSLINHLTSKDSTWNAILVVDECNFTARTEIWNYVQPHSPRIKLVTIYNEEDESKGQTTYLDVPRLSDDQIQDIIARYGFPKDDTHRWAAYCDGSPRVAHVIGWNLKENPDNLLASPDTIDVWKRYIAGRDTLDSEAAQRRHIVLRWLSLFKRFGYQDPLKEEAKLIAEKIKREEQIEWREFQRIVDELRRRKILQGETTLYITPKLLHIKLWAEWWDLHGSAEDFDVDSFRTVDASADPPVALNEQLMDWFFEQFRYANESKIAPDVVAKLLSADGPFEGLDFLDTDRGSKFFLYLTETDPANALKRLKDTIGKLKPEELKKFGDGRRNVVWALQRIVVWRRHFADAAELLLKLSVAENETWSNNATGVFTSLFSPGYGRVAASEASPQERFPILKAAMESNEKERRQLALKAASHALETNFFSVDVGAEYQGLRKGPSLWIPKTYGELHEAYEIVWDLLVEKTKQQPKAEAEEAAKILFNHSRSIITIQRLTDKVIATIQDLAAQDKQEALSTVVTIIHYDTKRLPAEVITKLKQLRDDLTGTGYRSLLERYVALDLLEDHFADNGEQIDQIGDKIKALAEHSVEKPEDFRKELGWLISGKPQNGHRFGYALGQADKSWSLLPTLIDGQRKADPEDGAFFVGGYFRALRENDSERWEKELDALAEDKDLSRYVGELSWRSGMNDRAASRILKLAQDGVIKTGEFRVFGIGSAIEPLSESALLEWLEYILQQPERFAVSIALDFIEFYYVMKNKGTLPKDLTKRVLLDDRLFTPTKEQVDQMEDYHWSKLADAYIEAYPNEAPAIAGKMLEHFDEDGTVVDGIVHKEIQNVLNKIAERNPEQVWESVKKHLTLPMDMTGYRITYWLKGEIQFGEGRGGGALALFPPEKLWEWIEEKEPQKRARFAAQFVPSVLFRDEKRICFARELLVRYGQEEDVRSALRSNFITEGWSGSASSHYIQKRQGLLDFKEDETDPNVILWIDEFVEGLTAQIKQEKIREERSDF